MFCPQRVVLLQPLEKQIAYLQRQAQQQVGGACCSCLLRPLQDGFHLAVVEGGNDWGEQQRDWYAGSGQGRHRRQSRCTGGSPGFEQPLQVGVQGSDADGH